MMTHAFIQYMKENGSWSENEMKALISRIGWIETTLNVSMDSLLQEKDGLKMVNQKLEEVMGAGEKLTDFQEALQVYHDYSMWEK